MELLEEFDFDEEAQIVDGFDDCIIGKDYKEGKAVYGIERMIEKMMIRDGMTMEMAIEFFDHNIGSAYVGELTPIYVWQGEETYESIAKIEKIQES